MKNDPLMFAGLMIFIDSTLVRSFSLKHCGEDACSVNSDKKT